MSNLTHQHLARLYQEFHDTEVTFNTQVILESGLITSEVHLTIGALHLPCVLYASSMKGARVIAEIGQGEQQALSGSNSAAILRLGFKQDDEKEPVSFFVSCRVESMTEYNPRKPLVQFITLEFTHKPSDVLIGILGSLLEIKANTLRRRDQRIVLTPEVLKKIGLQSRESCLAINGSSRRCLLGDLSFGGAKVLLNVLGFPQDHTKVFLKLGKCEVKDDTILDGSIVRVEDVEGHDDLVALSIQYSSEPPISYKQRINSVFTQ